MNELNESIDVLVVEADKHPYVATIPDTLEAKQEMVGGYIEAVYPFRDTVCCICNDEGKLMGLEPNRMLWDEQGDPYDVLCGTFLVTGLGEEDFKSLTQDEIDKYSERFWNPEFFALSEDKEVIRNDHQGTEGQISKGICDEAINPEPDTITANTEELDICY